MLRPQYFALQLLPVLFLVSLFSFPPAPEAPTALADSSAVVEDGVHWMSMAEAMEAMEKEKKLIFIDVYTDWCGWCQKAKSHLDAKGVNCYKKRHKTEEKDIHCQDLFPRTGCSIAE